MKASNLEQLHDMEGRLKDRNYKKQVQRLIEVICIPCNKMTESVSAALDSVMTTEVQMKVNVVYGNNVPTKHYTDHISLQHHLPTLFGILLAAISKQWQVSEKEVRHAMSERLKHASTRFQREKALD
jgi:hypothetical protein